MSDDAPTTFSRLLADAGRCRSCRHAALKTTARSVFVWCRRSETDSRFAKYPRLPVIECSGYEQWPQPGDPDKRTGC